MTNDRLSEISIEEKQLSTFDRYLPAWIGLAMLLGVLLGNVFTSLDDALDKIKVDTVSLPIAIGLLVMMYPVLAKVQYSHLGSAIAEKKPFVLVLIFNWLIGPLLMFALAWIFLPNDDSYRTGLVIVGLAPCIAMVIIWIDLANGNRELAALFVAINSIIQVVAFSGLGYFYLKTLPGWMGLDESGINVSVWDIAKSVLIFLGIPLVAGYLTRRVLESRRGTQWYEEKFIPKVGPFALYGLLFTIVILFALQGDRIIDQPVDVVKIALPLIVYFGLMWGSAFAVSVKSGLSYDKSVSVAFTAAGNNFELAIAVCIAVFGISSGEAMSGVVGPLIEVPALILLVYVARWARHRFAIS